MQDVVVLVRRALIIAVASLSTRDRSLRLTYLSVRCCFSIFAVFLFCSWLVLLSFSCPVFAQVCNILLLLLHVASAPFLGNLDNLSETLTLTVLALLTIVLATAEAPLPDYYLIGLGILIFGTVAFFVVKMIYSRSLGVGSTPLFRSLYFHPWSFVLLLYRFLSVPTVYGQVLRLGRSSSQQEGILFTFALVRAVEAREREPRSPEESISGIDRAARPEL
jgi:hypothetical protein